MKTKIVNMLPMVCVTVLFTAAGILTGFAAGRTVRVMPYSPEPFANLAATSVAQPAVQQVYYSVPAYGPLYVVTLSEGYVAVFQDGVLLTQTERHAGALPPEELQRLYEGIAVFSEEQLTQVLQDYGS